MCACPGDCEGGPECLDDEGGPPPARDLRPFAVCAPGNRLLAELVLALHGEHVSEVREHPWFEGSDVYVITPPGLSAIGPPYALASEPSRPLSSLLLDRLAWAAVIPQPLPFVLGSVI